MVARSGWQASVPGNAAGGVLVLADKDADAVPTPVGVRLGAQPIEISLEDGSFPAGGAHLSITRASPVPAGQAAALAYFDEAVGAWHSVPTSLSTDRRTLSALVSHFSVWSDVYYEIAKLATKRVDAPLCDGRVPTWVRDHGFLVDPNAPVRWCIGADPKRPNVVVLKVRANRSYGFSVRPAVKPEWVYTSLGRDLGVADLLTAGITNAINVPEAMARKTKGILYLAPGTDAEFGFTEAQVRSADAKPLLVVERDPTWMVAGLLQSALEQAVGSEGAGAFLFAYVAALQCAHEMGTGGVKDRVLRLGNCAVRDPAAVRVLVTDLGSRYTKLDAKLLGKIAGKAEAALWGLQAMFAALNLTELVADGILNASAYRAFVFPTIVRKTPTKERALAALASAGLQECRGQEGCELRYANPRLSTLDPRFGYSGPMSDPEGDVTGGIYRRASSTTLDWRLVSHTLHDDLAPRCTEDGEIPPGIPAGPLLELGGCRGDFNADDPQGVELSCGKTADGRDSAYVRGGSCASARAVDRAFLNRKARARVVLRRLPERHAPVRPRIP